MMEDIKAAEDSIRRMDAALLSYEALLWSLRAAQQGEVELAIRLLHCEE